MHTSMRSSQNIFMCSQPAGLIRVAFSIGRREPQLQLDLYSTTSNNISLSLPLPLNTSPFTLCYPVPQFDQPVKRRFDKRGR
jgi:hypothetical protein